MNNKGGGKIKEKQIKEERHRKKKKVEEEEGICLTGWWVPGEIKLEGGGYKRWNKKGMRIKRGRGEMWRVEGKIMTLNKNKKNISPQVSMNFFLMLQYLIR